MLPPGRQIVGSGPSSGTFTAAPPNATFHGIDSDVINVVSRSPSTGPMLSNGDSGRWR